MNPSSFLFLQGWRYQSAAYTATVITGLYLYLLSQFGVQTTIGKGDDSKDPVKTTHRLL
jgi:hypothetical protein